MRFDGHRVSKRWYRVLRRARREGVRFSVISARRTLAEQWRLFRQNMYWNGWRYVPRPGRPLTAFPSPFAPHIRRGRANHALDINTRDGGEYRLQSWLSRQGAHPTNPVRGEPWHLELGAWDLRRLARRFR